MTKNREIKYILEKRKKIPNLVFEELNEVRKKYKNKSVWDDLTVNDYIRDCNFIINEFKEYKRELLNDKNKRKYALNISFPIRKKDK